MEVLEGMDEETVPGSKIECEVYLQEKPTTELLSLPPMTEYGLQIHQSRCAICVGCLSDVVQLR